MRRGSSLNDFSDTGSEPVVGEVIAVRQFVLRGSVLYGLTHRQPTLDGVNVAVCRSLHSTHHDAPRRGCVCGFYAYDWAKTWVRPGRQGADEVTVTAVVALSGRVVVCERGLKAEKMRVLAVSLPLPGSRRQEQQFKVNYPDVDIVRGESALLAKYPLTPLTQSALHPAPVTLRERMKAATSFRARGQIAVAVSAVGIAVSVFLHGGVASLLLVVVAAVLVGPLVRVIAGTARASTWEWDIVAVVEGDGVRPAGIRWGTAESARHASRRRYCRPASHAPVWGQGPRDSRPAA